LDQALSEFDGSLRETFPRSFLWREKKNLLSSVLGVGPRLALILLADLRELRRLDRKKISVLVHNVLNILYAILKHCSS